MWIFSPRCRRARPLVQSCLAAVFSSQFCFSCMRFYPFSVHDPCLFIHIDAKDCLCFQITHLASNNMFLVGSFVGGLLLGFSMWQSAPPRGHHSVTLFVRYLIRKTCHVISVAVRSFDRPSWFAPKKQKILEVDFKYYVQEWLFQNFSSTLAGFML